MSRRLLRLAVLTAIGWMALWAVASWVVVRFADTLVAATLPKLEQAGLAVDSLSYSQVKIAPTLMRAVATRVSADFDLAPRDDFRLSSTFEAREMSVELDNPLNMRGRLGIEGFEVIFHETDQPRRFPFDRLTNGDLVIGNLPLLAPREVLQNIRDGLDNLLDESALVGEVELRGDVQVRIHDRTLPARLYTEREGSKFRLRFDAEDVQTLVDQAAVDLSPEQVAIVSLYPVRLPFLIDITSQARALAWNSHPQDRYSRDALRHVAWSFLLATEFGPEFAKEVTDAQETKPGNTTNERTMDYHNNAVGRQMATTGVQLQDLPRIVSFHPDVIRHPSEVDSRQELLQ